ncbi:GNAT family N-acetyltransferase [Vibrio kyushuensis]|uniref:GNAT family N-acetyltransferase n=1 Tax=Vibrio kyushuensis TaxID=2910249 RepID=UPI003D0B781B
MLIREATKDDLVEVCLLTNQINELHHTYEPCLFSKPRGAGYENDFWEDRIVSKDTVTLVAELDNTIHGFLLATITALPVVPFLEKQQACRINTIVVSKEKQNTGIGKLLFSKIESWAKEQGFKEIKLEVVEFNERAKQFYEKLGFRTQTRILSKSIA